jgi:hypothetical protein
MGDAPGPCAGKPAGGIPMEDENGNAWCEKEWSRRRHVTGLQEPKAGTETSLMLRGEGV